MEQNQEIKAAADLSYKMAQLLTQETQSSKRAIQATAILYASLASMYGMSMHDAMGLLMDLYKKHEQFLKENGDV